MILSHSARAAASLSSEKAVAAMVEECGATRRDDAHRLRALAALFVLELLRHVIQATLEVDPPSQAKLLHDSFVETADEFGGILC